MGKFTNPFISTAGESQSTIEAKIEGAEAALTSFGPGLGRKRDLEILKVQLQHVIRVEKGRLRASGRFITGLAERLPVGLDENELALGAILGTVGGATSTSPFTRALLHGIF